MRSTAAAALAISWLTVVTLTACRGEGAPAAGAPQEVTIVVGATTFSPESVTVAANRPLRLHFQRTTEAACADQVVFTDLGIRKALPPNQTTTVDLPAQHARTLTFACGQDMLRGKLLVQ